MQAADFDITPRELQRVGLVLGNHVELLISDTGLQELGYMLAPVLCKNAQQQDQFQVIYNNFVKEIRAIPDASTGEVEIARPTPQAHWWLPVALALTLLIGGGFFLNWYIGKYGHFQNQDRFQYEVVPDISKYTLGDTFSIINNTAPEDTAGLRFEWYIRDKSDNVVEGYENFQLTDIRFENPVGWDHSIQMIVRNNNGDQVYGDAPRTRFRVHCLNPPDIVSAIQIEGNKLPGDTLTFSAEVAGSGFEYRWYFDHADSTSKAIAPQYVFDEPGQYRLTLTLQDTTDQLGYCADVFNTSFVIEEPEKDVSLAELPPGNLLEDPNVDRFSYGVGVLLLLLLFLLPAVYYWWQWLQRKYKYEAEKAALRNAQQSPKKINDQAPYDIPFRDRREYIQVNNLQFGIASILRRRQEGSRRELDVTRTIKGTVEQAGFLDLQYTYNTRPTDYLFLIDQRSVESHQARLFQYLTEMLREQDVHIDYWTYRGSFDHFWHPAKPEGLDLAQLYKWYADRKLIIFGDGASLLDPDFRNTKDQLDFLGKWKYRLLVTPRPINSWSAEEAVLYRHFPIFPADLGNLMEAVSMIEAEWEVEDLPNEFADWRKHLHRKQLLDPDSEQPLRRWDHYRKYLQKHPALYPWLKALVVHPDLRWNLTIAIGRAIGAPVTFDNLLILSRLPAFDEGAFPEDIWEEIWELLDPEDELKAHAAVREELLAINQAEIAGSYAKENLKNELIIHEFALAPYNLQGQKALQQLLLAGQLNLLQLEALDLIVDRHTQHEYQESARNDSLTENFLRTEEEKEEVPFFTENFWWASALSVLALGFVLTMLLTKASFWGEQFGEVLFLIDKQVDEKRLLNNQAVAAFDESEFRILPRDSVLNSFSYADHPSYLFLQSALDIDPNYALASNNIERLLYLMGKKYYEALGADTLYALTALDLFQASIDFRDVPQRDTPTQDLEEIRSEINDLLDTTVTGSNKDAEELVDLAEAYLQNELDWDLHSYHAMAHTYQFLGQKDSVCNIVEILQNRYLDTLQRKGWDLSYTSLCTEELPPIDTTLNEDSYEQQVVARVGNDFIARYLIRPSSERSSINNPLASSLAINYRRLGNDPSIQNYVDLIQNSESAEAVELSGLEGNDDRASFLMAKPSGGTARYRALLINVDEGKLLLSQTGFKLFADSLRTNGYEVEVINDPTRAQMLAGLQKYQDESYGPDDHLLIYFNGNINQDAEGIARIQTSDQQWITYNHLKSFIELNPCDKIALIWDANYSSQLLNTIQNTINELDNNIVTVSTNYLNELVNRSGIIVGNQDGKLYIATSMETVSGGTVQSGVAFRNTTIRLNNSNRLDTASIVGTLPDQGITFLSIGEPPGFTYISQFQDLQIRRNETVGYLDVVRFDNIPRLGGITAVGPTEIRMNTFDLRYLGTPIFSERNIVGLVNGIDGQVVRILPITEIMRRWEQLRMSLIEKPLQGTDNTAFINIMIGTRVRAQIQGFIIAEEQDQLFIAAPYVPLSSEDLKLFGPSFQLRLPGVDADLEAEPIIDLEEEGITFLVMNKPEGYTWQEDFNTRTLTEGEQVYLTRATSNIGNLGNRYRGSILTANDETINAQINGYDNGYNLILSNGGIAGLALNEIDAGAVRVKPINRILRLWEAQKSNLEANLNQVTLEISISDKQDRRILKGATIQIYQFTKDRNASFLIDEKLDRGEGVFSTSIRSDLAHRIVVNLPGYTRGTYELTTDQISEIGKYATVDIPLTRKFSDNMVFIEGGNFQMGDIFGQGEDRELPIHSVTLSDYYLSKYEVTFAEYDQYCEDTRKRKPKDEGWGRGNKPVINVSWFDAVEYCNWRSEEEGLQPVYQIKGRQVEVDWTAFGYRLPTEAEWEYSARSRGRREKYAGTSVDSLLYKYANFENEQNRFSFTAPIGSFLPNSIGLYDMSGNVYEWCWDWYGVNYYSARNNTDNPKGIESGSYRVNRGGGWARLPNRCRTTYRLNNKPTNSYNSLGFRLALGAQ